MGKKTLSIIASAYRATLEEQDDTIVWLTHTMRRAGAELDVVLSGNAVNYAVQGQDASGLAFGEWRQTQPPTIGGDLAALIAEGARVFICEEDLAERGIEPSELVGGVELLARGRLPRLLADYDQVWRW
jgi:intracellular sulfur oxidation DsrE/DsrF family protein